MKRKTRPTRKAFSTLPPMSEEEIKIMQMNIWRGEGNKKEKSLFGRMGHFNVTKEWLEPVNFTGEVVFYTDIRKDSNEKDYWLDYKAKFVDGLLKSLELVKVEATDNTDRKAQEIKWKELWAADKEFRSRWYIKYTYIPYERCIRFIFRNYNRLKQKLPPSYKIERLLTPF